MRLFIGLKKDYDTTDVNVVENTTLFWILTEKAIPSRTYTNVLQAVRKKSIFKL